MTKYGGAPITAVRTSVYRIPTDLPEGDGTFRWSATTLVVVNVDADGHSGLGYTYADTSAATLIRSVLAREIANKDGFDIAGCGQAMRRAVRNLGREGIAACALSAVDVALWDLKARCLDISLSGLLGQCRPAVPVYGSGGFTTYTDDQLRAQLSGWVERDGCRWVKMKIGSDPERDPQRAAVVKRAIGERALLFVDANGAFSAKQALGFMQACPESDIRWFEEPVSSDDIGGLRRVRKSLAGATEVAAGEYIYSLDGARKLLEGGAVDVLQADVTRCGGISGFLQIGALCEAHHLDLSGHCAPSLHRDVACAVPRVRHLEWFHDHVRIEQMLFDGAPQAHEGAIRPEKGRPGHGLQFKHQDAKRFAVEG